MVFTKKGAILLAGIGTSACMSIFPYSDKERGSSEIMSAVVILADKPQYEESLIKLKLLKIHHKIGSSIKNTRRHSYITKLV
jgi:hypothetical protein